MSFRSRRLLSFTLLLLLGIGLSLAPASQAQTFRGGINGVVTDQSGAVVPSAEVVAVDPATGVHHTTITSSGGEFTFQDLPLGAYDVTATAPGFQKVKVDKVPVKAGSIYSLPIKLSVAQQATTIEVNAAALSLDTTSTTQTAVVSGKPLQDTPLNGRDFTQLIILSPGFSNSGAGGYGSLNGTRANQINWQIDGIDNNDLWHNIPAVNQGGVSGIAGIILPIDAVDQFSAQTQAAPESGQQSRRQRQSVAEVRQQSDSRHRLLLQPQRSFRRDESFYGTCEAGSSQLQLWFLRRRADRSKTSSSGLRLTNISGSLSAFPIRQQSRRSRGRPKHKAALANFGVPVNPVSTAMLSTLWPAAATGSLPATVNNYTSSFNEYGYSYNGLAKIDYTINDKNSLTAHWFVGQGNQVAPVGSALYYYYEVAPIHVQNYAIVYNHVFTPTITNQLLLGVNYFNQVFNDYNNSFDMASLRSGHRLVAARAAELQYLRLRSDR